MAKAKLIMITFLTNELWLPYFPQEVTRDSGAYVSQEEAFVINRGAADAIASPASLVLGVQEKKNFN
jgi:hypothetical protein